MSMLTRMKLEAREKGERYFTSGAPCKYGHLGPRYASTGACLQCLSHKTPTPLTDFQQTVMRKFSFHAVLPLTLGAEDVNRLDAYLLRCVDQYCKVKGVEFPFQMAIARWIEETGRPREECPY